MVQFLSDREICVLLRNIFREEEVTVKESINKIYRPQHHRRWLFLTLDPGTDDLISARDDQSSDSGTVSESSESQSVQHQNSPSKVYFTLNQMSIIKFRSMIDDVLLSDTIKKSWIEDRERWYFKGEWPAIYHSLFIILGSDGEPAIVVPFSMSRESGLVHIYQESILRLD